MSVTRNRIITTGEGSLMIWITAPATRIARTAAVLMLAATFGACDALDRALNVEAPDRVDASDMSHPQNAGLLVSGAIADFDCALGGYIVSAGLLGNELRDASITAARHPLDSRNIDDSSPYATNACTGSPTGVYRPISTAIWTTNNALARLTEWTDAEVANRTNLIAQAAAYSGYAHILMGEGFCSSVITELGPEVQPAQIFQVAIERFTTAIQAATSANNADMRHMALLGRARANINLGRKTEAAADARALLASAPQYVKNATASAASSRRWNRIGAEFFSGFITVEPSYRELMVQGVPDTRVLTNPTTNGHDNRTMVWVVAKYGSTRSAENRTRPVPIATWREAHLIIAEAEGGQEAVNRINVLRAHHNLPAYEGGSAAEIQAQIVDERARELYLEGHHLGDLRRFNIPSTPAPGSAYHNGGIYGSIRCFPLPAVEKNNNPNFR
jgi:starch-binding outer membrane protein, SusD/RagB family